MKIFRYLLVVIVVCLVGVGGFFYFYRNIKVSVIVPVYNTEQYLDECLSSLEKQTLKNMEFIIIDDGSTDNSFKIMQKYAKKDKRFKIYSKQNEGVGKTRNMGLSLAKGQYIGFVDSDDYVSKNYFEGLYNVAKKYDAEVSVICDYIKFTDGHFEKVYTFANEYTREGKYFINDISYLIGDIGSQWDKIYKKSFLNKYKIRSYEKRLWFEDEYFSSNVVLFASSIAFTNKVMYFYRYNPKGITQSSYMNKDNFEEGLVLYDDLYKIINSHFYGNKKEVLLDNLNRKVEWYKNTYNKDNILYN